MIDFYALPDLSDIPLNSRVLIISPTQMGYVPVDQLMKAVSGTPITSARPDIPDPVVGQAPEYTWEDTGTDGEITAIQWPDALGDEVKVFEAGNVYTVEIDFVANDGYTFIGITDVAVNGFPAVIKSNVGSKLSISAVLTPLEPVEP